MESAEQEVLVDSCIWIEFFRGGPAAEMIAAHLSEQLSTSQAVTLNVALAEVSFVLNRDLGDSSAVSSALETISVLSRIDGFSRDEAVVAGALRAEFRRKGRDVSYADCIQMAWARARGAKVLSKDTVFKQVPEGLYVEDR